MLTGYTSTTGVIASTDSILSAIQKLNGNLASLASAYSLTEPFITPGSTNQIFAWDKTFKAMTDAMHGARGGGTQHAVATQSVAGFMSAADKTKLDNAILPKAVGTATVTLVLLGTGTTDVTIPGLTTANIAICSLTTVTGGISLSSLLGLGLRYAGVCTANTLTLSVTQTLSVGGTVGVNYVVY